MTDLDAITRNAFMAGVEFGFIMGEQGHNLDRTFMEARKVADGVGLRGPTSTTGADEVPGTNPESSPTPNPKASHDQ